MATEVNQQDLYIMLTAAIRYSLGRRTYITGCARDWIKRYAKDLADSQRSVIVRDIIEHGAHRLLPEPGERIPIVGNEKFGSTCDQEVWDEALRHLVKLGIPIDSDGHRMFTEHYHLGDKS